MNQPQRKRAMASDGLADRVTFGVVQAAGLAGVTSIELSDSEDGRTRAGSAGSLSRLHKDGKVARLAITRGGSHIYVTPENVGGRRTEFHGWSHRAVPTQSTRRQVTCPSCRHQFEVVAGE